MALGDILWIRDTALLDILQNSISLRLWRYSSQMFKLKLFPLMTDDRSIKIQINRKDQKSSIIECPVGSNDLKAYFRINCK